MNIIDYNSVTSIGQSISNTWQSASCGITGIKKHSIHNRFYKIAKIEDSAFNNISNSNRKKMLGEKCLDGILSHEMISLLNNNKTMIIYCTGFELPTNAKPSGYLDLFPSMTITSLMRKYKLKCDHITLTDACATSTNGLIVAECLLNSSYEYVLVIAIDSKISFDHIRGFERIGAYLKSADQTYSIYDNAIGTVLGEASSAILLGRSKGSVNIKIIKTVSNIERNSINHDMSGFVLFSLMDTLISETKIDTKKILFINGHGTGTRNNSITEKNAMKLFSQKFYLKELKIVSFKSFYGHTTAASGILDITMLAESVKRNKFIDISDSTFCVNARSDNGHIRFNKGYIIKICSSICGLNTCSLIEVY